MTDLFCVLNYYKKWCEILWLMPSTLLPRGERNSRTRVRESEREYSQLGVVLFLLNIFVLFFFFFPRHPIVALKDSGDYNAQKFKKKTQKKGNSDMKKSAASSIPFLKFQQNMGEGVCVRACSRYNYFKPSSINLRLACACFSSSCSLSICFLL